MLNAALSSRLLTWTAIIIISAAAAAGSWYTASKASTVSHQTVKREESYLSIPNKLAFSDDIFGLSFAPVVAQFTVSNTNNSGPGSLRQAILDANANAGADTINFNLPPGDQVITLTSGELLINGDLTINGPGPGVLSVNGNAASRIFNIGIGRIVSISGMTVTNGNAAQGAGIFNDRGSLTLTNCVVSGNVAASSGGGIYNNAIVGTAVIPLTLVNTVVSGNGAANGGGIYAYGFHGRSAVSVTGGGVINNNVSGSGGGIYSDGSSSGNFSEAAVTITDSVVSGNTANNNGGGVYNVASGPNAHGPLMINNSTVNANSANSSGGGIYNQAIVVGDAFVTITGSTISGNQAAGSGGGIYSGETPSALVSIINSDILDNHAVNGPGGGIRNVANRLTVQNSRVNGNTAINHAGGGIFNEGLASQPATATVTASTVALNMADQGGGIYSIDRGSDPPSSLTIDYTTISQNSSSNGGGLLISSGVVAITNSTFSSNSGGSGGGGVNNGSGTLTVRNSTISGNSAGFGGGINNSGGGSLTLRNSTLNGNSAQFAGGGVSNSGSGSISQIGNTIFKTGPAGVNLYSDLPGITSTGYNLSNDNGSGFLTGPGDQINIEPLFGPLENNGGPTFTHALLAGSPAINTGDPGFTSPPDFDQRGLGFSRIANSRIDIGAFEVQASSSPTATPTATPTPSIGGRVTYENAAVPVVPVPFANLDAAGSPALMTSTDTNGDYSLSGFGAGPYTVTPSKAMQPFTTPNGIFSNDAALISRHVVGIQTLSATQLMAAMVGGGPGVSSFDAGLLAQYIVGIPNMINLTGQWKFTPVDRSYASVTSNQTNQDYAATLMGDVSGDWAAPSMRVFEIADRPVIFGSVFASVPDIKAIQGKQVTIPLRLDNLWGEAVSSYQFTLEYDPSVIKPEQVAADLAGTMAEGTSLVYNSPEPGILKVAVYSAFPVTGDGIYLFLNFTVIGKHGSVTPLSITGLRYNDGTGQVTTIGGAITVSE